LNGVTNTWLVVMLNDRLMPGGKLLLPVERRFQRPKRRSIAVDQPKASELSRLCSRELVQNGFRPERRKRNAQAFQRLGLIAPLDVDCLFDMRVDRPATTFVANPTKFTGSSVGRTNASSPSALRSGNGNATCTVMFFFDLFKNR